MSTIESNDTMTLDYQQTIAYFHALHEVRFKLIGFLPIATGAALVALPSRVSTPVQFALACFGVLVTIGLSSYDQRNTQIYDRLVRRVRFLEKRLVFMPLPGEKHGGPFHCRPPLKKMFGMRLVWHIQGLTIVYAASLTGWWFLLLSAMINQVWLVTVLAAAGFVVAYVLLRIVSRMHHLETERLDKEVET